VNDLIQPLSHVLPGAQLTNQSLVFGQHTLELSLLDLNSEGLVLDARQIGQFWQNLPYWAFAWAAGQGLAQYILANPELVRGKRVLDFGSGSGLVGIAAAKAGASSVLCCDTDPIALIASQYNAEKNGVDISVTDEWVGDIADLDCLLAADILYDLTSSGDLADQCATVPNWLVAETQYQLPPWSSLIEVKQYQASTWPMLDDFDQDLTVSIYCHNMGI
jgi:predicted nicotinamide N-methyase